MKKIAKNGLMVSLLCGVVLFSFADRGVRKKAKSKQQVVLNVSPSEALKKKIHEMKAGDVTFCDDESNPRVIKSFQKGNTIYLLPTPQKIFTTEVKQGYTGLKIVIKSK